MWYEREMIEQDEPSSLSVGISEGIHTEYEILVNG